jgi:uncharacterized protein
MSIDDGFGIISLAQSELVFYNALTLLGNLSPKENRMSPHPIVHIEIVSTDVKVSSDFYSQLFGWKIQTNPEWQDYYLFNPESGPGGAFMPPDDKLYKAGDVVLYAETDDIEGTLKKVEELGGTVVLPKTDIPGVGWFALFSDPTGVRLALYTPLPRD